jgi:flagellar biosynthesis/type III secretory pathway protein FliH
VHQQNPIASALMAKMKMTPKDRPKVKLECLCLLASLKLNPARSKLIGGFIDTYLNLTAQEMQRYEREIAKLEPEERKEAVELMSSWERRGLEKGREEGMEQGLQQGQHQGKEEILSLILEQRFSTLPDRITKRLDQLTSEQMNELGKALLSFASLDDLEEWLARH